MGLKLSFTPPPPLSLSTLYFTSLPFSLLSPPLSPTLNITTVTCTFVVPLHSRLSLLYINPLSFSISPYLLSHSPFQILINLLVCLTHSHTSDSVHTLSLAQICLLFFTSITLANFMYRLMSKLFGIPRQWQSLAK